MRQHVELIAAGALGEDRKLQVNVPLEHQRIVVAQLLRRRTIERDGAGDVGRPVVVLRTGVEEKGPLWLDLGAGVRHRVVVDYGAIGIISSDGGEAVVEVAVALGAEAGQDRIDLILRRCLTTVEHLVEVLPELRQRYAVPQHRPAAALVLGLGLDRLEDRDGTHLVDDDAALRYSATQLGIGPERIHPDDGTLG